MVYLYLYDGPVSEVVEQNGACVETQPSVAKLHDDVRQQSQSNSPKRQSEEVCLRVAKYLVGDTLASPFIQQCMLVDPR